MNRNRIQFYPDVTLLNSLNSDAERFGVAISTLVTDILKRHYGLVPELTQTHSDLNVIVFSEVIEYISKLSQGEEFDLLSASPTYAKIDMTYAGNPSAIRAKIGKTFAKSVGSKPFTKVAVNKDQNGKIIRSKNNAATYVKL
ncbi:MAG: hypothetical protein VB081_09795 [Christensenella sp.]|uniref:hypothetical protein n=1 Tax=Christensenella sp. TaxID=1935934 RepID=UPI002B20F814|nr:hypothetical protein [Christensenella sp.]MEA5003779.1 hypothetical protein [Christensenella sp.]